MTYPAIRRRCEDCPHNGEAVIAEAQAQYLESVIEAEDDELEHLQVCATCHEYNAWRRDGQVGPPECAGVDGDGLERCRFSPSRWVPYWHDMDGPCEAETALRCPARAC